MRLNYDLDQENECLVFFLNFLWNFQFKQISTCILIPGWSHCLEIVRSGFPAWGYAHLTLLGHIRVRVTLPERPLISSQKNGELFPMWHFPKWHIFVGLTSLGNWTGFVHPDFQNGSKKLFHIDSEWFFSKSQVFFCFLCRKF